MAIKVDVKVTEKYDAASRKRTITLEVSPDPIEVDSPTDIEWRIAPGSSAGWDFHDEHGIGHKHRQYEYKSDSAGACTWQNKYLAKGRTHRYTINLSRHGTGPHDPPATISWDPTIKNQ
jgi:hypothetical protein